MLILVKPRLDELAYRQHLLADSATMAFNQDGIISFDLSLWNTWYQLWMNHPQYYYAYIKDTQSQNYVGEVSYYYEEQYQEYVLNIIIEAKYRRLGYGKQALKMLCKKAKKNGLTYLCDDIALNSPYTQLFRKHGFKEVWRNQEVIMLKKKL